MSASPAGAPRLALLDAVRAVAAQLIVLHHLAWYGPLGDTVRPLAPALVDWLALDARRAVQVFLVLGGFVAAMALAPRGAPALPVPLSALVARRWLRLAPAYLVATVLAIGAAAIGRLLLQHESIGDPPTLAQVLAHAAMLQDVLGTGSLSAGAWYVAIDLQLYAGFAVLLWLAARWTDSPQAAAAVVVTASSVLAAAGLLAWGHDVSLDAWAPHYVGAFGLGALAWWAGDRSRGRRGLVGLALLGALVLAVQWRDREAVAIAAALLLCLARRADRLDAGRSFGALARLGASSYSLLVVHYPVCLLANALASGLFPGRPAIHLGFLLAGWVASVVAGIALHRWVEAPSHAWARRLGRRAPAGSDPPLDPLSRAEPARARPAAATTGRVPAHRAARRH